MYLLCNYTMMISHESLIPTEVRKRQIYEVYQAIFKSSFPEYKKINIIHSLFLFEPWSWRVIGITTDAIREFVDNDFRYKTGTFNRDHFLKIEMLLSKEWLWNLCLLVVGGVGFGKMIRRLYALSTNTV